MAVLVKDIMTRNVLSVGPSDSLLEAADMLMRHGFNGLPVVDWKGKLVGILTQYDLISKSTQLHLPTFQRLIEQHPAFRSSPEMQRKQLEEISSIRVEDVMNKDPLVLHEEATFKEAVDAFYEHHRVDPIPVVDKNGKLVGIVSRYDILKTLHADFMER